MVVRRKDTRVVNTLSQEFEIDAVGKYILISEMNFFIFSRVVVFRGSYFIKAIENCFPVFA